MLIAGQRRLQACKMLGLHEIQVHYVNLDDIIKGEYHENDWTKRIHYFGIIRGQELLNLLNEKRQRKGRDLGK